MTTENEKSQICIVSTRPPKAPLSGGMAPAVKLACSKFQEVTWFAIGVAEKSFLDEFQTAAVGNGNGTTVREYAGHFIKEYDVEGINVVEVLVKSNDWDRHYNTYCNMFVWPTNHDMPERAIEPELYDIHANLRVNDQIADVIVERLKDKGGIPIWAHDYHHEFLLRRLREKGVLNPVLYFCHTPRPSVETLTRLGENGRRFYIEQSKALLHADVVNFQTEEGVLRFLKSLGIYTKNPIGMYEHIVIQNPVTDKAVRVGHFPISIDTKSIMALSQEGCPLVTEAAKSLQKQIVADNIFINFERCDYSKGILERVLAFRDLLSQNSDLRGKVQMIIGAEPTRKDIKEYVEYAQKVKDVVQDEINARREYWIADVPPVVFLNENVAPTDVLMLMKPQRDGQRMIGTVTPFRDGMNLVAKEFAAVQDPDNAGVLIISEGAGAAAELDLYGQGALIYKPPETENRMPLVQTMLRAIRMPQEEANERIVKIHTHIEENDIYRWAEEHANTLADIARSNGKVIRLSPAEGHPASSIISPPIP